MPASLKVLIVEDNAADAELFAEALRSAGFSPEWQRVEEESAFLDALHPDLDLVLSDYQLPKFDGLRALTLLRGRDPDVPFILISGTVGEEIAVQAIQQGATHYIRKSRLAHLGPAVEEALRFHRAARERRLAAQALSTERTLLRTLLDLLPDSVYVKDTASRFLACNATCARQLGAASPAEVVGKSDVDFHPPELAARFRTTEEGVLAGRPLVNHEHTYVRADGSRLVLSTTKIPWHDGQGRIAGIVGTGRDITAQKAAELRSELQHNATRVLAEVTSPTELHPRIVATVCRDLRWDIGAVWMVDRATNVLRCHEIWHVLSPAFAEFAAASRSQNRSRGHGLPSSVWASGQSEWISDLAHDPRFIRQSAAARAGLRSWIGVPIVLRREILGVLEFFSTHRQPCDPDLLAVLTGIGIQLAQFIERQQLSERFRRAQKMEAIGTLAGGIAHDFNNILTGINGYTQLAQLEAVGQPELSSHLEAVLHGTTRATELVRQILTFSRRQEQPHQSISLAQPIQEALALLRATIPASIAFSVSVDPNTPLIRADPTQIHQVIMNLGTNAAHAMRERPGCLTVNLEPYEVDADFAATHPGLRPGPHVRLTLSDTGHGMTPATLNRIFEPFFTTKTPGEGTGLGLAVVHGIVESHGGTITVYSHPGEGTAFHLYFPVQPGQTASRPTVSTPAPIGHGERILYVDDEPMIALMVKKILERLGYHVDTHINPLEALAVLRATPAAYDLLITDQMMPAMMGTELAEAVHALRPDLPIILTTGYTATLTGERIQALGIRKLLLKPLSVDNLGTLTAEVLAKSRLPKV